MEAEGWWAAGVEARGGVGGEGWAAGTKPKRLESPLVWLLTTSVVVKKPKYLTRMLSDAKTQVWNEPNQTSSFLGMFDSHITIVIHSRHVCKPHCYHHSFYRHVC